MPTTLEIDESIIHSQLRINTENDELQNLIDAAMSERETKKNASSLPYKTVKPKPGFCVKTRNLITAQKIFINICHTNVIPAPVDLTDSELTQILESEEPTSFRIPMSLGEGHDEVDKSGQPCTAYDIAINSTFFSKVESSLLFQTFLVTIAMEGLEDKYKMELDKNGWNVLKNRKCFGTMQVHRIEQRDEKPFVQEVPKQSLLGDKADARNNHKLIEEVREPDLDAGDRDPLPDAKYTLVNTRDGVKILLARIPVHERSVDHLSLSVVSNNCLSLNGLNGEVLQKITLPYSVEPAKSRSIFNKTTKIVTVLLPVV